MQKKRDTKNVSLFLLQKQIHKNATPIQFYKNITPMQQPDIFANSCTCRFVGVCRRKVNDKRRAAKICQNCRKLPLEKAFLLCYNIKTKLIHQEKK